MNKTKIEWCNRTWNPVTGCLHDCPYCYARGIARRFGKRGNSKLHVLEHPELVTTTKEINEAMEPLEVYGEYRVCPYLFGFDPTFHRYKLERPQTVKTPQNVFVCSMADLFGEWVPEEWIWQVFEACKKAPWHRYLFLTKNPKRYEGLINKRVLPSYINSGYFFGNSITTQKDADNYYDCQWNSHHEFKNNYWINRFFSVEPLYENINLYLGWFRADWVIIGAETGNRKNKIIPKREWIENIVWQCHSQRGHQFVPVFMKDSLAEIWGEPLIQEYPWEKKA
ncbi:MAG: phage Gp37/Gp68 family protein [Treponema sp.]|nr:phage Gp37/Gp68 family protein [Treponema sp.]